MKRTFRLSDSRPDPRRDVSDEIRFHLDMRAQELIEQGVPPEDAWREARRQFGDVAAIEAECRDVRAVRARASAAGANGCAASPWTCATRCARSARTPASPLAAVLTLGLGHRRCGRRVHRRRRRAAAPAARTRTRRAS